MQLAKGLKPKNKLPPTIVSVSMPIFWSISSEQSIQVNFYSIQITILILGNSQQNQRRRTTLKLKRPLLTPTLAKKVILGSICQEKAKLF